MTSRGISETGSGGELLEAYLSKPRVSVAEGALPRVITIEDQKAKTGVW
ncbi:MAG: hypothetical protein ACK50J_02885 [Planctomyces sp.]